MMRGVIVLGLLTVMTGCATVDEPELSSIGAVGGVVDALKPVVRHIPRTNGVYHKVQKGETLWRIAKTYKVSLEDIRGANGIPNAALIETNQLLFIPGADDVIEVVASQASAKEDFIWPLQGRVVSFFNDRRGAHYNRGIRIEARAGTPVKATRDGYVVFADYLVGHAHTIILDHGDGFYSVYGHNAKLSVELGDHVLKGDIISRVGQTRLNSYLHFEIRSKHKANNPLFYLPRKRI